MKKPRPEGTDVPGINIRLSLQPQGRGRGIASAALKNLGMMLTLAAWTEDVGRRSVIARVISEKLPNDDDPGVGTGIGQSDHGIDNENWFPALRGSWESIER